MILYFFAGVLGLVLGSFLNVCIFRLPRYQSIVRPRSRCPRCGQPIRWYDNIPVVSYAVLRGCCRNCGERISPIYPLVEVLTAALLVAGLAGFGLTAEFVKFAVLGMLLVVIIFTDLTARKIPHPVTLFGMAVGLTLSLIVPVDDRLLEFLLARFDVVVEGTVSSLLGALSGGLFGAGLFYAVGEIYARLRHKQGLGFGDVMLMGMVGVFLGVPQTYLTILLGSLLGSLVAVVLYVSSPRFRHDYRWPYGTFLAAAGIYVSWGGKALLDNYLHWTGF
ncbi:MAG TPA: prepilin peptidase [Terriglobia bacterium]|nr:prepilin peptidase [Terriglobia bacterium]